MPDLGRRVLEREAAAGADSNGRLRLEHEDRRSGLLPYQQVVFEPRAYRAHESSLKKDKTLLSFDKSLSDLRRRGYSRHASPQEIFGLLIQGLENSRGLQEIADDMLTPFGEWTSLAFERKGKELVCYVYPEGLVWDVEEARYHKTPSFKFSERRSFDVGPELRPGMPFNEGISSGFHTLRKFRDNLVEFLYTRRFKDLPRVMMEAWATYEAGLVLPSNGEVWPVIRGGEDGYVLISCRGYGGSRGVNDKKVTSAMKVE